MNDKHRIGYKGEPVSGKKAAGILFTDGKSILLLKRAGEGANIGKWSIPGGKSHENETEINNARRETMEEAGLKSIPGDRIDSHVVKNGHHKFSTFIYRVSKPFEVKLSKEHSEHKWVPFDEISKMELHPKFKKSLPELMRLVRKKITNFSEWCQITEYIKKA